MAEIFRLPAVSPTMDLGTIEAWSLSEGDTFGSGDVLLEVGTDKASVEAQIFEDGTLLKRLVDEGDEVPVNAPIAIFGEEGEDIDGLVEDALAELEKLRTEGSGDAEGADDEEEETDTAPAPKQDADAPAASDAPAPTPSEDVEVARSWGGRELPPVFLDPPAPNSAVGTISSDGDGGDESGRVIASPLARAKAKDQGIDLTRLTGSGPGGRIVAADVDGAPKGRAASGATPVSSREDETIKLTPMRRTIAKRLTESHTEIPSFYLTVTFDMTRMVALRADLKAQEIKVSYNDLFVACVGRALKDHPAANAEWTGKAIVRRGAVDVGIAVAVDDGLITPVVRGADQLTVVEIGQRVRDLAGQARDGTLAAEDYQGNTFTVSNLGMYGIEHFTAIINPPASAIVAVGALRDAAAVVDGELTVQKQMTVTMTCDHRVIDGATGAEFLQVLRRYVETPALLLT